MKLLKQICTLLDFGIAATVFVVRKVAVPTTKRSTVVAAIVARVGWVLFNAIFVNCRCKLRGIFIYKNT